MTKLLKLKSETSDCQFHAWRSYQRSAAQKISGHNESACGGVCLVKSKVRARPCLFGVIDCAIPYLLTTNLGGIVSFRSYL